MALDRIGIAHARLIATIGNEPYEENIELPVRPASPTITVGGYLTAKPDNARDPRQSPQALSMAPIGLNCLLALSPQLQLPEGLDYLNRYPYGCAEQTTSTLFPLVYLNDIGDQIAPRVFEKSRHRRKSAGGDAASDEHANFRWRPGDVAGRS